MKCKQSIQEAAILAHPHHSASLALMCDASDTCAGAVLQQHINNHWQPLGYFSKKFSDAQTKYSAFDRELTAIYMAVKHFRKTFEGRHLIIYTDHKPLTYAFTKINSNNEVARRTRQILFIAEFTTDIRHISGTDNIVADALSRVDAIAFPTSFDYDELATAQEKDSAIQDLLKQQHLNIKKISLPTSQKQIYCECSTSRIRPYIPEELRRKAFNAVHELSHPGIRTTRKLIQDRFFWPAMNIDVGKWAKTCIACQKAKVQRHTSSTVSTFPPSTDRFSHLHIDIVGPLPTSPDGKRYLITMVDRATRWPEATPVEEISAETTAKTLYETWISRFGCPVKITSDQGRQFESQLFIALAQILGAEKTRTTAYHPQSNGLVERWHRCMKAALKARLTPNKNWVDELPTVMLGLRAALRADTRVSAAELTYGQSLRLPSDFFTEPTPTSTMDYDFVSNLRRTINNLKPQPEQHHSNSRVTFVHPDLEKCEHVFVRIDAVRKPLQPPYEGPYRILKRNNKFYTIHRSGQEAVVSIDRLKPAYTINESEEGHQQDEEKRTRSGRTIRVPVRFTRRGVL